MNYLWKNPNYRDNQMGSVSGVQSLACSSPRGRDFSSGIGAPSVACAYAIVFTFFVWTIGAREGVVWGASLCLWEAHKNTHLGFQKNLNLKEKELLVWLEKRKHLINQRVLTGAGSAAIQAVDRRM
jgi:hypothetical protein